MEWSIEVEVELEGLCSMKWKEVHDRMELWNHFFVENKQKNIQVDNFHKRKMFEKDKTITCGQGTLLLLFKFCNYLFVVTPRVTR